VSVGTTSLLLRDDTACACGLSSGTAGAEAKFAAGTVNVVFALPGHFEKMVVGRHGRYRMFRREEAR